MPRAIQAADIIRLKWNPRHLVYRRGLKYIAMRDNTPMIVLSKVGTGTSARLECLAPTGAVLLVAEHECTTRGPWAE